MAMIAGLLLIALPIAIISQKFQDGVWNRREIPRPGQLQISALCTSTQPGRTARSQKDVLKDIYEANDKEDAKNRAAQRPGDRVTGSGCVNQAHVPHEC